MQKEEIVIEDGTVSWFYGEQVPAGFYWVVLDVIATRERESTVDDKWFTAQWQGAILTAGSVVEKSSQKFAPRVGACFVQKGTPHAYKLKLKCFYSLEEAEEFRESGKADAGWMATYDWTWMELFHVKFKQLPAPTNSVAPNITGNLVAGDTLTVSNGTWGGKSLFNGIRIHECWLGASYQREQTEQQRIAQRQVDLNKAKISKLEKELKDLRELQKLLKGMR